MPGHERRGNWVEINNFYFFSLFCFFILNNSSSSCVVIRPTSNHLVLFLWKLKKKKITSSQFYLWSSHFHITVCLCGLHNLDMTWHPPSSDHRLDPCQDLFPSLKVNLTGIKTCRKLILKQSNFYSSDSEFKPDVENLHLFFNVVQVETVFTSKRFNKWIRSDRIKYNSFLMVALMRSREPDMGILSFLFNLLSDCSHYEGLLGI